MPQDNKPTTARPPLACHARSHMGAEFHVYDYMVAACKQPQWVDGKRVEYKPGDLLVFHGRRVRIANAVNRSLAQVDESLEKLEDPGWIISLQGPRGERKQRRTQRGRQTTIEYRVLEHDEYARKHDDCPSARYDEETMKPIKPGRMAPALENERIREMVQADLPEEWLEAIGDSMAAKKGLPPRKEILSRKKREGK